MATYAAFKHVELYNVGKTKKRVLRPPGGGSSDIFGADLPQTPRSIKNHMQSHIFSNEKNSSAVKNNVRQGAHRFYIIGDQPRRGQKSVDSYSRLFGEPDRPNTPAKNHMKSSIPFGKSTEAATQLLANGNGHGHHHSNGKSGSVSSTSSSVSSSTENLKMNGISKTVLRNMSSKAKDDNCPKSESFASEAIGSEPTEPLDMDLPCEDKSANLSARSKLSERAADPGSGDVSSQTRRDDGCNPPKPYSLSNLTPPSNKKEPLDECISKPPTCPTAGRNPITGLGLGGDGVGGLKPKKPKNRRDGNPVTGEGYKSGNDMNSSIPSLNGANQVINKNRIPPGGFSSGLW